MTRPALEVADVVRQYGAASLARYGATLSPEQHRALRAIAVCRTAALGGHATQCEQCGHLEITYNSCGNRHCPKCPGRAQAAWLAAREAELLDVPYVHVVFTLPHALSPLTLQNPRVMYTLLFQAVAVGSGAGGSGMAGEAGSAFGWACARVGLRMRLVTDSSMVA